MQLLSIQITFMVYGVFVLSRLRFYFIGHVLSLFIVFGVKWLVLARIQDQRYLRYR